MGAFYWGARPGSRFHKSQNVIVEALKLAKKWDYLRGLEKPNEFTPEVEDYYKVLVKMVRLEPERERLFDGTGNFGTDTAPAAWPPFTECRLTPIGAKLARDLLKRYLQSENNAGALRGQKKPKHARASEKRKRSK
jgi:hypothetical protein